MAQQRLNSTKVNKQLNNDTNDNEDGSSGDYMEKEKAKKTRA